MLCQTGGAGARWKVLDSPKRIGLLNLNLRMTPIAELKLEGV